MKLRLVGHAYKYAVEQILLQTMAGERPEFTDTEPAPGEDFAVITLRERADSAGAHAELHIGGAVFRGRAETRRLDPDEGIAREREKQRIIKTAFFRAARQASDRELPWGATTGIRPSTLITRMTRAGLTPRAAERRLIESYYVSPERAALALDCAEAEKRVRETLGARDVALYVGIPFCPTRCAYCSFVSHSVERSMVLIAPFLDALKAEAAALAKTLDGTAARIVAVYVGGGTPTTLDAEMLDDLLGAIAREFDLSGVREYTVEAGRPDTITAEKLAVLRSHGVGRVSVNPQTFSDEVLENIGRKHTCGDTLTAYALARSAGFEVINMDLIAGLPGDTEAGFRETLERAIALAPENLTVHTLSLKRGARVTLEKTPIPGGEAVSHMLTDAFDALGRAGYAPYYLYRQKFTSGGFENTGWAKPGAGSLYNVVMMDEVRSVLALGAGVTKLVGGAGRIVRVFNPKYPYEYIERIGDIISGKGDIGEFLKGVDENGV